MAKIKPNQPCPCGSEEKFKKCCALFLGGSPILSAERLVRTRYCALAANDTAFLWRTLHPSSARKLKDTWNKFESEQKTLYKLDYRGLVILDGDVSDPKTATIVFYVRVFDGNEDVSYLEEDTLSVFETTWQLLNSFRKSSRSLRCDPLSIKIGQLATLFPWDTGFQ